MMDQMNQMKGEMQGPMTHQMEQRHSQQLQKMQGQLQQMKGQMQ